MRVILFLMLLSAGCTSNAQSAEESLQANVDEKVEIVDGPLTEAFSKPVEPALLDRIERETVRRGLERLGWDGLGEVPVTARSRQAQIGPTVVIITEQSLYGYVAIVEVAGVVEGRLSSLICRSKGHSYIEYPTSQCAKRATDHFGSASCRIETPNG